MLTFDVVECWSFKSKQLQTLWQKMLSKVRIGCISLDCHLTPTMWCSLILVSILGAVAGAAAIHYYRILRVSPAQKRIVDLRHFGQPRRGTSSYSRYAHSTSAHPFIPLLSHFLHCQPYRHLWWCGLSLLGNVSRLAEELYLLNLNRFTLQLAIMFRRFVSFNSRTSDSTQDSKKTLCL